MIVVVVVDDDDDVAVVGDDSFVPTKWPKRFVWDSCGTEGEAGGKEYTEATVVSSSMELRLPLLLS